VGGGSLRKRGRKSEKEKGRSNIGSATKNSKRESSAVARGKTKKYQVTNEKKITEPNGKRVGFQSGKRGEGGKGDNVCLLLGVRYRGASVICDKGKKKSFDEKSTYPSVVRSSREL